MELSPVEAKEFTITMTSYYLAYKNKEAMKSIIPIRSVSLFLCFFSLSYFTSSAQGKVRESYRVETIEMPKGLSSQTGGIDFLPDGRLVACFMRGEVMMYNLKTKEWKLFAEGLQLPLGILAVSNSEVLVMQLSNLIRIKDTDGDGHADLYENATSDFGMSGNYHEFNYGPVRDKAGNLFIALNCSFIRGWCKSGGQGGT